MSATYNWAYKPGVINKYGITINASDDGVCPSNACYVGLFGNDNTGNGSRQYPYRTLTKAINLNLANVIVGSGVYRELSVIPSGNSTIITGDGDVIIDFSYNGLLLNGNPVVFNFNNIKLIGNGINSYVFSGTTQYCTNQDVHFSGCFLSHDTEQCNFIKCTIDNFYGNIYLFNGGGSGNLTGCTIVNCNKVTINNPNNLILSCIFYYCNISFSGGVTNNIVNYSLFAFCNYVLNGVGSGGVLYPGIPSGYTYYDTLAALHAAYSAIWGTPGFSYCAVTDPVFNNASIGDYSLSLNSPAKNLSYFGTYVGARSVAYPVTVSATESTGGFDFSTIVNLSVADNSITLLNSAQNGSIQTNLFVNNSGRQLARLPLYGFNADRNGQYIDSVADLAGSVQQAGGTLTIPTPYLVETGSITYNENVYQPGDRLTSLEGITTFSSNFGGTLREITEAPERHTIMMRCGNGGDTVAAGGALTAGYWYYVISGSVTYNGTAYGGGQSFKAIGSGGFSGSGNVITALGPESFNHYEPGIQPTTNNEGDTRTGAILRGNGDPAYVRGGYGVQEFPINARFIQLYYIINVANLKP